MRNFTVTKGPNGTKLCTPVGSIHAALGFLAAAPISLAPPPSFCAILGTAEPPKPPAPPAPPTPARAPPEPDFVAPTIEGEAEGTAFLLEFQGAAPQPTYKSAERSAWADFTSFCGKRSLDVLPWCPTALALYALNTVARIKNVQAWNKTISLLHAYATRCLGAVHLTKEQRQKLRETRTQAAKKWGIRKIALPDIGWRPLLAALSNLPPSEILLREIATQAIVMHATLMRPNEGCVTPTKTGFIRAQDVKFSAPSPALPFGSFTISLYLTKPQLATGVDLGLPSLAHAEAESPGEIGPHNLLKSFMERHGLFHPSRASEPLFATMDSRGNRCYGGPNQTGAFPISLKDFNQGLERLLPTAGGPKLSARGLRRGGRSKLTLDGMHPSVIDTLGRWAPAMGASRGEGYLPSSPELYAVGRATAARASGQII